MKLINEQNWKQEIARLKAEKIEIQHDLDKSEKRGHLELKVVAWAKWKFKKIDKAIETIENVFVHKQCYID